MATHCLNEGDTSPAISYALAPKTIILTGSTVVMTMRNRAGTVKINRASATVTDNGDGTENGTPTVQYDWTTSDTDTAGVYYAEFEVTYADSTIETFPNDGTKIVVDISKDNG